MRRIASILLLTALLPLGLATAACQDEPTTAGTAAEPVDARELPPDELGRIGARLHAAPDDAETILEEEGVTWEDFQAAVREVSADVDAARRYSEAFHAAANGGAKAAEPDPAS
jgi:hypothetical protein